MQKYGKWSEQENTKFRTSGDNKELTLTPPTSLSGASLTLTLPDNSSTADTLISRTSSDTGSDRLQNKELSDDNVKFVDNIDTTKKVRFLLNNITTGTERVLTLPDITDTLVTLTATQTLTNKTIDGDNNTVQDLALSSLKTTANTNVFVQRDGSGDVIDSSKAVPTGDVVGSTDTQTLTNKTINVSNNTVSNIADANIAAGAAITLSKLASLTASRALVSDGSGIVSVSSVTSTELGHLSGVTSAIQTQINSKQDEVVTTEGDLIIGDNTGSAVRLAIGASGTVLQSNGTTASWQVLAGSGDVTAAANMADNTLLRGDGGAKGIQDSGITIDDTDNMSGVGTLTTSGTIQTDSVTGDATVDIKAGNADQSFILFSDQAASGRGKLYFDHSASPEAFRIDVGASTDVAVITTAGDFGIGRSPTTADFEVYRASGNSVAEITSSNTGESTILFSDTTASGRGKLYYDHSTDKLMLDIGASTDVFAADTAGNIGIGRAPSFGDLDLYRASGDSILNISAGNAGESAIHFSDASANSRAKIYFDHGSSPEALRFDTPSNADIFRLDSNGVTFGSVPQGFVEGGTYTPTFGSLTNIDSATNQQHMYQRVGNVVNVAGQVSIDVTSGSTPTSCTVTLPFAPDNNFTAGEVNGVVTVENDSTTNPTSSAGFIRHVSGGASSLAFLKFVPDASSGTYQVRYNFSYIINN